MKKLSLTIVAICLFLLIGCTTYEISKSNLSNQLSENMMSKGYLLAAEAVKGNDLKTIKCTDKNGKEVEINVTNRTGVKITKTDNSSVTFYFNTLLVKDSSITGSKTHFFNDKVKPIKFTEISKIEIME